jgi:hypothetical protein
MDMRYLLLQTGAKCNARESNGDALVHYELMYRRGAYIKPLLSPVSTSI